MFLKRSEEGLEAKDGITHTYPQNMKFSVKLENWNIGIKWLSKALLIIIIPIFAARDRSFSSHKTNGISQIPWNMLLDPNYTSHKMPSSSANSSSNSPTRYSDFSSPVSSFPQNPLDYDFSKTSVHQIPYYVPSPTSKNPQSHTQPKFPNSFTPQEHTSQRIVANHFSAPVLSYRPPETVVFPENSKSKIYLPESSHKYNSRPTKKNSPAFHDLKATETKKQKKRKQTDYFDMEDDDYLDSYYQDYDYEMDSERPPRKAPKKTSHSHSSKYKPGVDPFGMLPSASDPEGFFAKAKDLLRGGSHNRPSYYTSNPDYYPSYQPSKPYAESDLYNTQSYYDQENNGYPSKTEYYGSPGYDYDTNAGDKFGGFIPYPEKRKGTKYGPLAFALGLLPLGLLLASLVPTVVTIPVTTAVATGRRRKRSVQFVNPVLDTITEYGLPALEDPVCLKRIFCQVVRGGKQDRSSIVQKLYYKLAYILDEKIADAVGLKALLVAVRKDQCQRFECTRKKNSIVPNKEKN